MYKVLISTYIIFWLVIWVSFALKEYGALQDSIYECVLLQPLRCMLRELGPYVIISDCLLL
jgi:hypothetical protein